MPKERFYSDNGKACKCGGTIFSYTLEVMPLRSDWDRRVETYCYGCHMAAAFYCSHWMARPTNPAECSTRHRSNIEHAQ